MKKNNNVFWIGLNSFFTDMSSEMLKPLIPIYLKVILNTPVWVISLFNSISELMANIFKIIFGIKSDNEKDKKKLILIGYAVSNLFKPFMFIIQSVFWLFFIELLNRIGKGIRSAPKEVIMTYSIEENKLGRGFGFQKAMDSWGAFTGTLLISLLLFIFGLEYNINFLGFNLNLFYIIMIIAIIPGLISFQIINKKVRNVYISDDELLKIKEKRIKKSLLNLNDMFNLGKQYNYILGYTILISIGSVSLIFFILELINKEFLAYQITLLYAIYTLTDALFSYTAGKLSDKKGKIKLLLYSSLFFIFIALLLTFTIGISKTFIGILIAIVVFGLLGMFEATFEGTFKKVIVTNVESNKVGTAMGLYMGVSGITKILIGLVFAVAWMNDKTDAVFGFGFLFILLSIIYIYILSKYKLIKI